MTIGNLVEIYTPAMTKVRINMVDNEDYLYDGLAKDMPAGFFKWNIRRLSLIEDKMIISVKSSNCNKEEYNEELKVFDLKSCVWLDNSIKYIVKYKDDSEDGVKIPQTLRALEKELWNESLIDKISVKNGYIMLYIKDTRENVMEKRG